MNEAGRGFDKNHRLLSAADFSYLRKNAKSFSSRWTRIYFKKTRMDSNITRIGIACTKKVGKANKRNLCKRVVREFFRTSSYKDIGLDMTIMVSPRLFTHSKDPVSDLRSALQYSFKKISHTL